MINRKAFKRGFDDLFLLRPLRKAIAAVIRALAKSVEKYEIAP